MKQILQKMKILFAGMAILISGLAVVAPAVVRADCAKPADANEAASCKAAAERRKVACEGAKAAGVTNCDNPDAAKTSFKGLIGTVINILSVIVGAVSVVMIIIGGFRYVVSNGDSNSVSGAKNTILYAIVGLVIVLFAQIIVAFVIDRATS